MFAFARTRRQLPIATALLTMGAIGYVIGAWHGQPDSVSAQTPTSPNRVVPAGAAGDYNQRVVAYIYGNIEITREDLGEFLISRYAHNRLELLVNRKIIEHACAQAKVTVTPEEVEAAITEDLQQLNVDRAGFVKQFLKQYNKSLYEWKEDVIKPRLMLTKLCQSQITVSEDELRRAFESQYGEKVECRLIIWPPGEEKFAIRAYDKIRSSEAEFVSAARAQANAQLAAVAGMINPISKPFDEESMLEKVAFKLKPGEVSELFGLKNQGTAVLRCERRLPPDTSKNFETEKKALSALVFRRKVEQAIPKVFKKMQDEAKPEFILKYKEPDVRKVAEEQMKLEGLPLPGSGPAAPSAPAPVAPSGPPVPLPPANDPPMKR